MRGTIIGAFRGPEIQNTSLGNVLLKVPDRRDTPESVVDADTGRYGSTVAMETTLVPGPKVQGGDPDEQVKSVHLRMCVLCVCV